MKRSLHILGSLIALATVSLAAVSCVAERGFVVPGPDEVKVRFHIRPPRPVTVGTRSVDADHAVGSLDLLVFERVEGEFVYKYSVTARFVSQNDNPEALFEATLRVTDKAVKLLAIANCPAGKLDAIGSPGLVTETEVRDGLTGGMADANPESDPFVMTGDIVLDEGISRTPGSIRIPMMRTVAKVTIEKASAVDNFEISSITVYRSADRGQYFPDVDAIVPPDNEARITPMVNLASVPDTAGHTDPVPVLFDDGLEGAFTTWLNENEANETVVDETCIVVGGWFGGQSRPTYYRMDFDTEENAPIFNPMGQVLRNFWYRFTVESVAGPGWDSPDAAANHPASQLVATVLPWNGGSDSDYVFGKDRYLVLSVNSLYLEAEVDDTDEIFITTSGLPFTITSERDPAAGSLDTADPGRTLQTDLMTFSLARADGAPAGQQRWSLTATALTADMIGDDLYLAGPDGFINVRIPVRRTGDFSVDRIGDLENVPSTGARDRRGDLTRYVEYEVHIPSTMNWSAAITGYEWAQGYLLDNDDRPVQSLTGLQPSSTLRVGFDKLYWPVVGKSPRVTIEIGVDGHSEMSQTIVVAQDMLPSMTGPLKVLDMYSSGYGSLQTESYIDRYTEYLKSTRLYSPGGFVTTYGPVTVIPTGSGVTAIPDAIDPSHRYIHIGGYPTTSYIQQRHDVVNSYWEQYGNDRIFVYGIEERTNSVFENATDNNSKRTTVLSMLGVDYLQPSGSGYVSKITTGADDQNTAVFRYLTQDGPFGSADGYTGYTFYNDGISSGVDLESLPPTAVPIIFDSRGYAGNCVMLFIDPANGIIYWGDSQIVDVGSPAYRTADQFADQVYGTNRDGHSAFLANLLAYIINCAQYGSSFADLFIADDEGNYPLYEAAFPAP